jgi:hypothetical protein
MVLASFQITNQVDHRFSRQCSGLLLNAGFLQMKIELILNPPAASLFSDMVQCSPLISLTIPSDLLGLP